MDELGRTLIQFSLDNDPKSLKRHIDMKLGIKQESANDESDNGSITQKKGPPLKLPNAKKRDKSPSKGKEEKKEEEVIPLDKYINYQNNGGNTALIAAAMSVREGLGLEIINILIEHGAQVNIQNKQGYLLLIL